MTQSLSLQERFYAAFEARFRGSPEEIFRRLKERYEPILSQWQAHSSPPHEVKALDLGCGRGEMLSLYRELGFQVFGCDQNEAFYQTIKAEFQEVTLTDIWTYLEKSPPESFHLISLLHVLEHLTKDTHPELFHLVWTRLKPKGVFLVETPSLNSLWVGARQFYLDPTHLTPVHPQYLEFLFEFSGFHAKQSRGFDSVQHPIMDSFTTSFGHLPRIGPFKEWLFGAQDWMVLGVKGSLENST